ncbi:MAG: nuclear transport factor 2 family protein [Candidatus Limnocylindria bacterium]
MQPSADVRAALLDFYAKRTVGDAASFDELVSEKPTAFIGTAPGEWFTDRERLRRGFTWAVRLDPGPNPQAWAEGTVGIAADEPTMTLPDSTVIRTRLTMFFRKEDGGWKIFGYHFSAGVPDDEVEDLQRRWLA